MSYIFANESQLCVVQATSVMRSCLENVLIWNNVKIVEALRGGLIRFVNSVILYCTDRSITLKTQPYPIS